MQRESDRFKVTFTLVCIRGIERINPLTAKLFNLNFYSLEVMSR